MDCKVREKVHLHTDTFMKMPLQWHTKLGIVIQKT